MFLRCDTPTDSLELEGGVSCVAVFGDEGSGRGCRHKGNCFDTFLRLLVLLSVGVCVALVL